MIIEGLNLALFGMGAVFIFLALLIVVTKLMSFFLKDAHGHQLVTAVPNTKITQGNRHTPPTAEQSEVANIELVLAAAIQEYKKRN